MRTLTFGLVLLCASLGFHPLVVGPALVVWFGFHSVLRWLERLRYQAEIEALREELAYRYIVDDGGPGFW
jgi:hypothetical protein